MHEPVFCDKQGFLGFIGPETQKHRFSDFLVIFFYTFANIIPHIPPFTSPLSQKMQNYYDNMPMEGFYQKPKTKKTKKYGFSTRTA